jgi:serine/threonine protein phosphatase PrpC
MRAVGHTDIGKIRQKNEDAYLATPPVIAVADGMGGHEAGDLAAKAAISVVGELVRPPFRRPRSTLAKAFTSANRAIRKLGAEYDHNQMGTTLTVAVVKNSTAWIGHIGDSRAYLLRQGELRQLTDDHSLVGELVRRGQIAPEKARTHPKRNVITRAVGGQKYIKPDIFSLRLVPGDRLILCTDGLISDLDDSRLADLASPALSPDKAGRQLIEAANRAGGPDNITVVIGDPSIASDHKKSLPPLVLAILGGTAIALLVLSATRWLNNTFYLTVVNGQVAVNRGLPVSPVGYKLGRVDKLTSINAEDLPEYYRDRLDRQMVIGDSDRLSKVLADLEELARRTK